MPSLSHTSRIGGRLEEAQASWDSDLRVTRGWLVASRQNHVPQHDATRCLLSVATTLHKTQDYAETNTPLDAQQLGNSLTDANTHVRRSGFSWIADSTRVEHGKRMTWHLNNMKSVRLFLILERPVWTIFIFVKYIYIYIKTTHLIQSFFFLHRIRWTIPPCVNIRSLYLMILN